MQKLLTKFPGLATSGRHKFAMITNAENAQPNVPLMGCLVFIFTVRMGCTLRTREVLRTFFGNR